MKPDITSGSISTYFNSLFELTFSNSQTDRLELISSIFEPTIHGLFYISNFETYHTVLERYLKLLLSSNDVKLIDFFFEKLSTRLKESNNDDNDINLTIGHLIQVASQSIKSKQVLEYLFNKYRNIQNLFLGSNGNDIGNGSEVNIVHFDTPIIEHYEKLMKSIDRKIIIPSDNWCFNSSILNRVISNPSLYSIQITPSQLETAISGTITKRLTSIIFTLSNIQFKSNQIINADLLFRSKESLLSNPILKFLFDNISKESITNNIKDYFNNKSNKVLKFILPITSNNNYNNNNNEEAAPDTTTTTSSNVEFESFIISKPKSITFNISINNLFFSLYYTNRLDDILYIFETLPTILENHSNNNNILKLGFYNRFSIINLQLFINHFINNIKSNRSMINHLYECLSIASKKGYSLIFKQLISNTNLDYLFKIKTRTNTSLFDSKLLIELVQFSKNINLRNLLLKHINFSSNDLKLLK